MVGGLLDLARAEAGVKAEDVDLGDVVAAVGRRFPGVEVRGGHCPVQGDRAQLETAVGQLVENARQHGGSRVVVAVEVDGVSVADDGFGISPAVLPHIFDRFFTTSADRKGTGLGLAIVRAIVEAHRGTLTVESGAGRTRFRLRF